MDLFVKLMYLFQTLCYLEGTPCKQMTDSSVRNCLRELKSFPVLADLERLMLVNNPPVNAVELQLVSKAISEKFILIKQEL